MRLDVRLRAHAWWLFLVAMAPVAALYLAGVFHSGPVFNGIGLSAVAAIVTGVLMHRPRTKAPWVIRSRPDGLRNR